MDKARTAIISLVLVILLLLGLLASLLLPRFLTSGGTVKIWNTPTLIKQVQTLSQLVTVKYVIEKVVILEDTKWYGENRLLLVANGVVKAGVDVSQLKDGDLQIQGKKITITLPPSIITDGYLDDEHTQVLERSTGIMRAFDKNLEQDARRRAVDDIKRAARTGGILKDADERARLQLSNLFLQLGFEQVEFKNP